MKRVVQLKPGYEVAMVGHSLYQVDVKALEAGKFVGEMIVSDIAREEIEVCRSTIQQFGSR